MLGGEDEPVEVGWGEAVTEWLNDVSVPACAPTQMETVSCTPTSSVNQETNHFPVPHHRSLSLHSFPTAPATTDSSTPDRLRHFLRYPRGADDPMISYNQVWEEDSRHGYNNKPAQGEE